MRLKRTSRVPLLLLACLATALLFPQACSGTRTGLGGLVFGTAALTGAGDGSEHDTLREENARLRFEVHRLRQDREAVPGGPVGELGPVEPRRPERADATPALIARVLHRDTSSARRAFVVDVGTDDGVRTGLPVLAGQSLVGVVQAVSGSACRVLRVDDIAADCRFPAVVLPADYDPASTDPAARLPARGVCQGTADGRLVVSFLARGEARPGDLVVTGPERYPIPAGAVLGEIVSCDDDDRDGAWEAVVRPLRRLDSLESVLVVRRPPLAPQVAPGRVR